MTDINLAKGIGREIIKQLHTHNEENSLDDSEYIPVIKRIVEAINSRMQRNGISKSENETLKVSLIKYAMGLYVDLCQKHSIENDENLSLEQVKEESEEFFKYIYKHEDYPE